MNSLYDKKSQVASRQQKRKNIKVAGSRRTYMALLSISGWVVRTEPSPPFIYYLFIERNQTPFI